MLYFVSTPIGNLGDISLRAIETLKSVDYIACEDTRHSLKLLDYYEIKKPLISYHKFNEKERLEEILNLLNDNKNIAVISDAGTPVISDPGNYLTEFLAEKGVQFTVIPGATAFTSALLLSGLSADKFTFIGFLPEKLKEKDELLSDFKNVKSTLIFYSAPHDVNKDLKYLYQKLGNRNAAAVKEITKLYEYAEHFNLATGLSKEPKGEYVLLVEGGKKENQNLALTEKEHIELYIKQGFDKKEALKMVAKERGVSKSSLYKYTIE